MTIIDTGNDVISIYNCETGEMAETPPFSIVESTLVIGNGLIAEADVAKGKLSIRLDTSAIPSGGGTVNINGLQTVAVDGSTITGNGTVGNPLVSHLQVAADGSTITGSGTPASPFVAPGSAAVYNYSISAGVSQFQTPDLSEFSVIEFLISNLAASWGVWPVSNIVSTAPWIAQRSIPAGLPLGYIADIILDMGGTGFNLIATRDMQFVKGGAWGVLRKLTYQPFGKSSRTAWIGNKIVPDEYNAWRTPVLNGVQQYGDGSDQLVGRYEYGPEFGGASVDVDADAYGVEKIRAMQAMTGNYIRLRPCYHSALGAGTISNYGTLTGGAVTLRCYK